MHKKNKRQSKKQKNKQHIFPIMLISIVGWFCISYILRQSFVDAASNQTKTIKTNQQQQQEENQKIWKYITEKISKKFLKFRLQKQSKYKYNFDLEDDASLQKYVSTNHPLNNPQYRPPDLEKIDLTNIINKARKPKLRKPARIAFEQLTKDFYNKFNTKLCLRSAYRSYEDQAQLIKNGCKTDKCARPAASEHNLWTAVDINLYQANWTCIAFSQDSKYYQRLSQNWAKYWFNNTYKRSTHEDWIREEARHRDYNWKYFAQLLEKNDLTIAEYYKIINN